MVDLTIILLLVTVGYISGTLVEKRHYRALAKAEEELSSIPVITASWKNTVKDSETGMLLGGSVVLGSDHFKTLAAALINIVGGRVTVYESLLDRGRREAIIRMKQNARWWGAERIINLRIETSRIASIGMHGTPFPCVEVLAYGTALKSKNALQK